MFAVHLPDGSARSFVTAITGTELAAAIGPRLARDALAVRVNGEVRDLARPLPDGARVEIITRAHPDALELIRHDTAHILAQAVQELFPGTQVTIGPTIENGFYYDFARAEPFSTEDLAAIEERMRQIIAADRPFVREVWARDRAIAHFTAIGEHYKAEIIRDLPASEEISIYSQGPWQDLCRGPHLPSTGRIGVAFKLMKVAGAYWRGDHRNPMLQRIYGTAWRDDKELQAYLTMLEEAERRDHRKLGRELELFHFQDEAVGSVFWHPHGWTLWRCLENYIRRRIEADGYREVRTPQLYDKSFFVASGHWDVYGDNMFKLPVDEGEKWLGLKPMNCPAHVSIYKQGIKSYRDLPLRLSEFGACHRNEPSGSLHGIMRVRAFTQDDAHIFCTPEQITDEALKFFRLQLACYRDLGFEQIKVKLALRPAKRLGSEEMWDIAEESLRAALRAAKLDFTELPGEGAFYAPKVEFHLTDAIGREWQCGTLQSDIVIPGRLGASYIGEDGAKHVPVMLHRAVLGSMERFLGILIEHHAGKLPLWLAPVQVVVATITNEADSYAAQVLAECEAAGLRAECDIRPEKINYKIREHSLRKVPLLLVVGAKESAANSVALRRLGGEQQQILPLAACVQQLATEALPPDLRPSTDAL